MNTNEKPVYELTISGYSSSGEGVSRLRDGRVVFVRGGARGDMCRVRLISEGKRSCKGEIVRIIEPSMFRATPDCPHYQICGGCDFRHITYEEELRAKESRVNDALERIGNVGLRVSEILTTGAVDGYRNKAVFRAAFDGKKTIIGFRCAGTHEVCPVSECLLLRSELNEALSEVWKNPPPSGSEILLRCGSGGDVLQRVSPNSRQPPANISEFVDGIQFKMSAESFFQVNTEAASLLFAKAREYAALKKNQSLLDLYCGVGALTLLLGCEANMAVGVESNLSAVKDAKENAALNNLGHIDFIHADAALWSAGAFRPDCIVVDPPRKGVSEKVIKKILELAPTRVVYVSCDPATLARDIKLLRGYTARDVCIVDMFPKTANVETVCLLVKAL